MVSIVSAKDETNPALWLATRAGKMALSCPLKITQCVPHKNIGWILISLFTYVFTYGPPLHPGP